MIKIEIGDSYRYEEYIGTVEEADKFLDKDND